MWGFGECSEPKLVRAEGNSPRREPGGNSEFAKPRHGATNRGGDIFRPLPGALPRTPHSHGSRRWATIFRRARETSLRSRYADPRESPGIGNPATSKSRARAQARLTRRGPAESKLVFGATGPKAPRSEERRVRKECRSRW